MLKKQSLGANKRQSVAWEVRRADTCKTMSGLRTVTKSSGLGGYCSLDSTRSREARKNLRVAIKGEKVFSR
jgi:hypothetical protein